MKNIIQQISAQTMRGFLTLALIFFSCCAVAQAQTTTFTYQGRLTVSSASASGTFDLEFKLFDAGGTQIGAAQIKEDVVVTNGIFTVQLDADLFEANAFDGGERQLEIGARRGTETGAFTTLTPRQPVTSTPYAVRSLNAATADLATNAAQLGGTEANEFVQTGDTRLSDSRMPTSGSGFYIQNQNAAAQTSANFNVSGDGTLGGTLSANAVNSATQFNIAGNRVLGFGNDNLLIGAGAGDGITTGNSNTFSGSNAGKNLTTGSRNAFFGMNAGLINTTGSDNAFFGLNAGNLNTTGSNNAFFGYAANVGAVNLNFAAAFGSFARVSQSDTIVIGKVAGTYNGVSRPADSVVIPGTLTVNGAINGTVTNATNAANAAQLGGVAANQYLTTTNAAASFIQNTTTQQTSSNFNVSGTGKANVFDATTQFNIGGQRALSFAGQNLIAGLDAGLNNTTGIYNSFFGTNAGYSNTSGFYNSFFGLSAGFGNTEGGYNSFFGMSAGTFTSTGSSNSFVGYEAGRNNSTGGSNVFVGYQAGRGNTTGGNNTAVGNRANVGSGDLSFATAIGSGAIVSTSNTIVLGRSDGSDVVRLYGLGAAGGTTLCRNSSGDISNCSSSLRYKTNITPFSFGMSLINQFRPISYEWKQDGMKDVGFGAEDVAKINPLFITYNAAGEVEGVKYDRLTTVFVNAFKEQQTQIETQADQIKEQQKQIDELKKIVCQIKPGADVCKVENK